MELRHVDIYITHNIRGFKSKNGMYGYVLAYMKKNGDLKTIEDYGIVGETTQNSIILTAMEKALSRMTEAADITIFQDSMYISNMFASGTINKWKENGFVSAQNKKIVDFTKWERVSELCEKHVIRIEYYMHHSFTDYITREITKIAGNVS